MTRHTNATDRRPLWAVLTLFVMLGAFAAPPAARAGASEDRAGGEVVVAASMEDAALRIIAEAFERETGVRVRVVAHDAATPEKLSAAVRATKADVAWSRDAVGVGAMANAGALGVHASDATKALDATLRDADGRWFTAATRARVMAYNTKFPPLIDYGTGDDPALPSRIVDAWNPLLSRSQVVFAHAESSSMRAHLAAMRAMWDAYETRRWAHQVKRQNIRTVRDEQAALNAIINETALVAIIDSDVAAAAKANGHAIEAIMVRHDRYDIRSELVSSHGALLLPILVALVEGGANSANGAAFVDFALSAKAQGLLASAADQGVFAADGAGGPERPARVGAQAIIDNADEALALFRTAIID